MNNTIFRSDKISVLSFFFLSAAAMLAISLYMTNHYFDVHFPEGIQSGTFCNINSYFNCDTATLSSFSNIAGVPISVFSLFLSVFFLIGFIFPSEEYEGSLYSLLGLNALGCALLMIVSLIVLKSLCPFCSLYYLVSFIAFGIIHKKGQSRSPSIKYLAALIVVTLAGAGLTYSHVQDKKNVDDVLKQKLIAQFEKSPKIGHPKEESPHKLIMATDDFNSAPIQMTVYSDFQCPACKMLSEITNQIIQRFKGSVNIQYNFFPLDPACNTTMKHNLHPYACKAAYLASCTGDDFLRVHDEIFHGQDQLSNEWLDNLAKKENVVECMNAEETKQKVTAMVDAAKSFNIKSTPTMILNGVKIEGIIPVRQLMILLESLVEKANK